MDAEERQDRCKQQGGEAQIVFFHTTEARHNGAGNFESKIIKRKRRGEIDRRLFRAGSGL
jgi:hypothetical protein